MAAKSELTVEERLKALYELQLIDSEKDEIEVLKGELPVEVSDLEDEIAGLDKRMQKSADQLKEIEEVISGYKAKIKESESLIERYTAQLDEVKNNREFEALTKEIELQKLEIELSQKRIGESQLKANAKKETMKLAQETIETRKNDLEIKRDELKSIISNTDKQEKKLEKDSKNARKIIDERLLVTYDKVRAAYRNGIAVATVERDSCGGCFNRIPSQKQIEIGMRKKIIACEHCGRVLVDEHILTEDVIV